MKNYLKTILVVAVLAMLSWLAFGQSNTGPLAANLTGSILDASLSANVPLLNAVNVFTAANKFVSTTNSGTSTATNGFSSDAIHFSKPPTNSPTDAYVWTATGTAGDGAWKVGGSASTGIVTNNGTGTNNIFTTATMSGTTTLTNGSTYIGLLNFPADTGGAFIDISVTATTAAGTKIGYTNRVDGNDVAQAFAISDGAGAVTNAIVRFPSGVSSARSNLLAVTTISVGASPFSWTNTTSQNGYLIVDGATAFSATWNATTVQSSLAGGVTLPLQPGEYTTVTYTVAPGMFFKPF